MATERRAKSVVTPKSFQHGRAERPRRLERAGFDKLIQDTAMSPDGRYILFCSTRPPERKAKAAKGARTPASDRRTDAASEKSR